jgi:predicted kinase
MRKWMRERIKRRKKPEETAASDANKPTPLQPDYYDAQATTPVEKQALEVVADAAPHDSPEAAEAEEQPSSRKPLEGAGATGDAQPRRRRRSRGGRGRSRSGPRAGRAVPEIQEGAVPSRAVAVDAPASGVEPDLAASAVAAPRASKGIVVLAIGLPGSGKSSWFKRHEIHPLSSDLLRALLFDDAQEQRFQDLVFSNLRSMLKARLIARRPMNYVDATNLTPHERSNWIKLAKDYGYEAHAVFFDVPLDVCLDRNRKRQRVVDEGIMQRMSAKLRAPTFDEGFTKITVVRVKKKDGEGVASEAS